MSGNFAIKGGVGGGVGRLMANAILNFHFDFLHPSLRQDLRQGLRQGQTWMTTNDHIAEVKKTKIHWHSNQPNYLYI